MDFVQSTASEAVQVSGQTGSSRALRGTGHKWVNWHDPGGGHPRPQKRSRVQDYKGCVRLGGALTTLRGLAQRVMTGTESTSMMGRWRVVQIALTCRGGYG